MRRPPAEVLGERLRAARLAAGFSQGQAAQHVGLLRPAMSLVESGQLHARALEVSALARLYGVLVEDLLRGL